MDWNNSKQCEVCGIIWFDGSVHTEEQCKKNQDFNDIHDTCGTKDTKCSCSDCETYFRSDIERPIISENFTDDELTRIFEVLDNEKVKEKMFNERYRSLIFQLTPYPLWSVLLKDKDKYDEILNKLKSDGSIPDENLEVCRIEPSKFFDLDENVHDIYIVSYRFPTSIVKYELTIYKETNKVTTHSRGSEY
jgi:hypothetical protein